MPKYTPYVKSAYSTQEGLTQIYIKYDYDRTKRTLINTGHQIAPKYWDDKKKWVKISCPDFEGIDETLKRMTSKLGEILTFAVDNGLNPTVEFVLLELEKNRKYQQRSNALDMFTTLELYIEEKAPTVSADQVKDYKSLRKHLTAFKQFSSQPMTFRNLNLSFYNEFMDYLSYKAVKPDGDIGLLTNSAGKIIRLLKGFVNYQIAKGAIPHIDMKYFKVVEEETDAIYLTENELKAICNLVIRDDKELELIRDIFMVGCYTGLRYSDLSELRASNIDHINGRINIKQRKVHKAVTIPMIDYVPTILKKYDYELPKVSSNKFNERLKELGKLIGLNMKIEIVRKKGVNRIKEVFEKWELISSHTCRRSFCTNMYLSGFPAEELMKISGHKSPTAFMRYIKVDNMQAADRLKELRAKMQK